LISGVAAICEQNVYDPSDNKIGDIKDVLIDKAGQIKALMIGVGGFIGTGEGRCSAF
jgi:sporulation protein YlmC with PRC-barrel domain